MGRGGRPDRAWGGEHHLAEESYIRFRAADAGRNQSHDERVRELHHRKHGRCGFERGVKRTRSHTKDSRLISFVILRVLRGSRFSFVEKGHHAQESYDCRFWKSWCDGGALDCRERIGGCGRE